MCSWASASLSTRRSCPQDILRLLSYLSILDTPIATVPTISGWLTMHRCGHDSALVNRKVPLGGRPFWCCNGSRMVPVCGSWPGEAGVSKAAAHRSLDEALVIVARRAISNIAHVLDRHQRSGELVVYLDGKSMGTDWGAARTESGKHLWYFGGARPSTAKCGS